MDAVLAALATLGDELAAHLLLAAAALALGLAVALPLTVWAARNRHVARLALGFASLVQTIPALALMALFYPLLLWLSALVGGGISALGFLPALLALAFYALLPILRNGVTGLASLDPAVLQAADAVGMTTRQKLVMVEAPLVAPFVMAGVRTAAVWTVGAATLANTVGQTSLGDPIFAGLQTQSWTLVLAGCLAAAGLALAADAVLALIERGIGGRPVLSVAGGLILAAALGWALWPQGAAQGQARQEVMTVGAKNFSEQFILARLIGQRLEGAGYQVRYREGLGSAVVFRALRSGDIDVYVDYAGTLWTNEMGREDTPPPAEMRTTIAAWLERDGKTRLIGALGFENAYAFAMRPEVARERGIADLDDLARESPGLTLGTDLEFLDRPEWQAVRAAYPLRFAGTRRFSPTFMYRALAGGEAEVITAFSSDGRIAADGLVVLGDPKGAVPNYDALLLASSRCAAQARCREALQPLVRAIGVAAMREANFLVDREEGKQTPQQAARWLARQSGL